MRKTLIAALLVGLVSTGLMPAAAGGFPHTRCDPSPKCGRALWAISGGGEPPPPLDRPVT